MDRVITHLSFFIQQQENLMNYLLVTIIVLAIIVIFINHNTIKVPIFTYTALIILLFDTNLFFLNHTAFKAIGFIPFKALFGPAFLFHIKFFNQSKISWKTVLLHISPFILLTAAFIYLLAYKNFADSMEYYYMIILLEGISMFLYGLYTLLPRHTAHSSKLRDIIAICSIAFLIDASFTILTVLTPLSSGHFDAQNLSFVNDTFFAVTVALGWIYFLSVVRMMINPSDILYPSLEKINELQMELSDQEGSYKKGRLSEDFLTEYGVRLDHLMQTEQTYLFNELTLTQLAKTLRITTHHLTQVLNIHIGLSFYQYINRLRIKHAITLIENNNSLNLELLASECGFNNRASFNRYFKEVTGEQPSVFIKSKASNQERKL